MPNTTLIDALMPCRRRGHAVAAEHRDLLEEARREIERRAKLAQEVARARRRLQAGNPPPGTLLQEIERLRRLLREEDLPCHDLPPEARG